jgi:hypothetical protein
MPELLTQESINVYGYWQDLRYYGAIFPRLQEEFKVKEQYYTEEFLKAREAVIGSNSASIHVRRGDYIMISGHIVLSFAYYMEALSLLPDVEELFIFSDDIEWCKEKFKPEYINKKITFVDMEEYLCLELMSLCKHNIIANSTFSWWAAMLNTNPQQKVIAPIIWRMNPIEQAKMIDGTFVPTNWIRI